jgi:hypothetical protein
MFGAQPPTQPRGGMPFHRSPGFAARTQTEVVGPSGHPPVEPAHHCYRIQQEQIPSGFLADGATDTLHPLRIERDLGPYKKP